MASITLASSAFLMPGNAAWHPLLALGSIKFLPSGQWLPQDDSEGHIVVWLWEQLLTAETLDVWRGLDETNLESAIDDWLLGLLQPLLQARAAQTRLYVGACSIRAGGSNGYFYDWLPLLECRFSRLLRQHHIQDLALPLWLSEEGRCRCFDERNRYLFSCPFSMQGLQSLAVWIATRWQQDRWPRRKVLVLDCDNTLWGGVLAEDGIERLTLGQDGAGKLFQAFQSAALYWYRRGVLLALCSKNNPDDVWRVFDTHGSMRLERQQIAAAAIGWEDKSVGLRQIAARLNVGLDALSFWDDSPLERAAVRAACPEIEVIEPPAEIWAWPEALMCHGSFHSPLTREDVLRQASYQALRQSEHLRSTSCDANSYLASLKLQAQISPLAADNQARAEQLTHKTNQFNLSCRRHEVGALQDFAAQGWVWMLSHQDCYADHGLVGLAVVLRVDESHAFLDTLALSCRVLSRGLENWFLHEMAQRLQMAGMSQLILGVSTCERNEPAIRWIESLNAEPCSNPDPRRFPHDRCYCLGLDSLNLPLLEYYNHD